MLFARLLGGLIATISRGRRAGRGDDDRRRKRRRLGVDARIWRVGSRFGHQRVAKCTLRLAPADEGLIPPILRESGRFPPFCDLARRLQTPDMAEGWSRSQVQETDNDAFVQQLQQLAIRSSAPWSPAACSFPPRSARFRSSDRTGPPTLLNLDFQDQTMSSYALDKSNAKPLGVCAGLARTTGWDPLVIRLGAVPRPCSCSGRSLSQSTSSPPWWPRAANRPRPPGRAPPPPEARRPDPRATRRHRAPNARRRRGRLMNLSALGPKASSQAWRHGSSRCCRTR